jgi:WD40 repeat protein
MQPAQQRGSVSKASYSPSFFFGTDSGALVYADDLGHCQDVQTLSTSIDVMLFFEERSRLVVITRSLLLTQYQVAEDGRVNRVMQVKLSVAGDVADRGLQSVVWASPGLLAIATHEKFIRLLDLAADESYNLSLSVVGDLLERNDRVISVAFSHVDRYLAVGTQMGLVVVWKYVGPPRDVTGGRSSVVATTASDWEVRLYRPITVANAALPSSTFVCFFNTPRSFAVIKLLIHYSLFIIDCS